MTTLVKKNIKKEKPGGRDAEPAYFAILTADVRYDKTLCPSAKLLYSEITALCHTGGYCWATNNYFANLYQVEKETISRWISQLQKKQYIRVEIDKASSNSRRIYLLIKKSIGIDKKINTYCENSQDPIDKKVNSLIRKNNTVNNTINNIKNSSCELSKAASLLRRFSVTENTISQIVNTYPAEQIETAVKNGLAKEHQQQGFKLAAGYILRTLSQAAKESSQVRETKLVRNLRKKIEGDNKKFIPKNSQQIEQAKKASLAGLGAR